MPQGISGARRTVLAYAEAHPDEAAFLSARELGERCGVSESTVIRAVQARGYAGYPEYQARARGEVARRRTTVERFSADHGTDPVARAFSKDIENLRVTWEALSPEAMRRAAELIAGAPRVWLLGLRMAHAPAILLKEGLSFLGLDARLLAPAHGTLLDDALAIRPADAMVAIALPRYTRQTVEAAALARTRGARLVALTDGAASPLAPMSEAVLAVEYGLEGYVESFTATTCLCQALLLTVAQLRGRDALAALRSKEALWAEWNVYWEG